MSPLVGFRCPPQVVPNEHQWPGKQNAISHCLTACPRPCVAPPLLGAIYKSNAENYHKGAYLSASLLTGICARQTWFERREPFYAEPKTRHWAFRGTHAHTLIEGTRDLLEPHGYLQELRLAVPFVYPEHPAPLFDENEVWTGEYDFTQPLRIVLGATTDTYDIPRRTIYDFKSMADEKADRFITGELESWKQQPTYHPNFDDSWVIQLNVYRYAVAKSRVPDDVRERMAAIGLQLGEFYPEPQFVAVQGIGMMEIPLSGERYKRQRDPLLYDVPAIPVWSLEDTEAYIRPRLLPWYRYLVLGERPPLVDLDKKWVCSGCVFNGEIHEGAPCKPKAERASGLA